MSTSTVQLAQLGFFLPTQSLPTKTDLVYGLDVDNTSTVGQQYEKLMECLIADKENIEAFAECMNFTGCIHESIAEIMNAIREGNKEVWGSVAWSNLEYNHEKPTCPQPMLYIGFELS